MSGGGGGGGISLLNFQNQYILAMHYPRKADFLIYQTVLPKIANFDK